MATATIGSLTFTQIGTTQTCSVTKNGNPSGSIVIPDLVTINGVEYQVTDLINFRDLRYVTHLTIPDSVTSLGDYAFIRSILLTSIKVDADNANYSNDSQGILYNIDKSILIACPGGLTSITIPNTVTSIASSSFYGSTIQSINIPSSVTSIGEQAFNSCSGLTSVTLNTGLQTIGSYAFEGCSGLTSVTIPNSVTSIGGSAFTGCSGLTSVTIPNSVTSISNNAFSNCSGLTSIIIPDSVTSIRHGAFAGCSGLTSVTIPNSVTSIGSAAFAASSGLTSVTIGTGVTSIESGAFADVSSSIEMYFLGSTIPTLTSIFGEPMGGEPMGGEPMGGGGIQGTAYYQVGTSDADKSRLLTVFSSIEEIVQAVCFLEDTKILTSTGYVKIQDLRKSDKVKTLNDGFVSIKLIGKTQFLNNYDDANKANCLYKLSKSVFKDLTDDLYVTGLHPILVDTPVLKNNKELKRLNWMHKTTDGKHRLLSYMNDGAEALKEVKVVTIWDFVLINKDVFRNYGVYANGLLTESMDENCFIKYSNFH